MRKIVFDIETQNTFEQAGTNDPAGLAISLVGVYDSETEEYTCYLHDELNKLWPILEQADMLIGFNSDHFDIPLLNKYYPGDLTRIKSLDLMAEIKKSLGRRIGLSSIAQGTLKKGKTGHGLEAITWWKNGEVDKIKKYCLEDVKLTKELYEYAMEHGTLKYKDGTATNEVKIDTSQWEQKIETAMTFTLPF